MTSSRPFLLTIAGALFACLPAVVNGQAPAPRDPYLAALERRERVVAAKRHNVLFDRHPWRPKPCGCGTGRICSDRGAGIQSNRVPGTDLVAVLHDIDRERDGLLVRVRFYNDGPEPVRLGVDPAQAYAAYYVEAGGQRRFILREEDGTLAAKNPFVRMLEPGGMESWWARFEPLDGDAGILHIHVPPASRFESISERHF